MSMCERSGAIASAPVSDGYVNLGEEVADKLVDLVQRRLEQEMPAVEQMYLGVGQVVNERFSARRPEDFITATPHRQKRHPAGPEVFVHARIHRRVGGVVPQQFQLYQVVARPGYQGMVVVPTVGIYQCLVRHAGEVLPLGGVQREELSNGGLVSGVGSFW